MENTAKQLVTSAIGTDRPEIIYKLSNLFTSHDMNIDATLETR